MLEFEVEKNDNQIRLVLKGNLLHVVAEELEKKLFEFVGEDVVIDFSQVGLITSRCLAVLVDFLKKQEKVGKTLKVVLANSYVKKIFEMVGLISKFEVVG